jgi:endonuclease YncB( thermonuclease family)
MRGGLRLAFVFVLGLPSMAIARNHAPCPPIVHRALSLRVVDGDTFRLYGERIRIVGIDTPERGDPGSGRAAYRLLALLRSGHVVIVRHGRDVYCRTLADVYVDGWNVAAVLRAEGYAKPASLTRQRGRPARPRHPTLAGGVLKAYRGHRTLRHGSLRDTPAAAPRADFACGASVRCRRRARRRAGGGARSSKDTRACRSWDSPMARSPARRRADRTRPRW